MTIERAISLFGVFCGLVILIRSRMVAARRDRKRHLQWYRTPIADSIGGALGAAVWGIAFVYTYL